MEQKHKEPTIKQKLSKQRKEVAISFICANKEKKKRKEGREEGKTKVPKMAYIVFIDGIA